MLGYVLQFNTLQGKGENYQKQLNAAVETIYI